MNQTKLAEIFKRINNAWTFNLYMWKELPAAYWSGVRLEYIDFQQCIVKVPYKRFSKNPFGSTYFACLAMAAEMSTGVPGLVGIQAADSPVSMLVVNLEAHFSKKATDITYFTCKQVEAIFHTINEAIASGEGKSIKVESIGKNQAGEVVATFYITWSFKRKSRN